MDNCGSSGQEANPWANFFAGRCGRVGVSFPEKTINGELLRSPSFGSLPDRQVVMLHEVVEVLMQGGGPDSTYVDCTFGRGGYTSEILSHLSPHGRVIAFDIDPSAVVIARALERREPRFKFHDRPHGDFVNLVDSSIQNLMGVVINTHHTTQAEDMGRSNSFADDGPLDLRLNPGYGMPASEWLLTVSVAELAWVIHEYGEDNDVILSQRLAEAILLRQRRFGPYRSASELADVCRHVKQGIDDRGQHPAKLTFQAIRCFLSHEAEQLDLALLGAMERLQHGGRCIVISHRQREASQVKCFVREHEDADGRFTGIVKPQRMAELYPQLTTDYTWACRQISEPLRPSTQECDRNGRARVVRVHVLAKESRDPTKSPCRGLKPRLKDEQFKKPPPLPFQGSTHPEVASVNAFTNYDNNGQLAPNDQTSMGVSFDNVRKGDWICPQCSNLQLAGRLRCDQCGSPPIFA